MFHFLAFFFLLFSSTYSEAEATKYTMCNCEEIEKTKKCEDPKCIPICEISTAIEAAGKVAAKKCMEKGIDGKSFSIKKTIITKLEDFLHKSEEEIKKAEEKHKKILKEHCPECALHPQTNVSFVPIIKKETCEKKHLKTHDHKVRAVLNLTHSKKCTKQHITQINHDFQGYVEGILRKNKKPFSKKIYKECPDGCSFDVTYIVTTNEEKCLGDLELKVACTHQTKKSWFVPVYDISLNYEGNVKCQ